MIECRPIIGLMAALLFFSGTARAEEKESEVVVELGGAGEWGLQHGGSSSGPSVAVEFTIIEHWLEIETGVTPLFANGQAEVGTDLIFKKPFDLSDSLEFVIGAGPEWVHKAGGEKPADSIAGEAITELVYFPWQEHKVGFFLEQIYSYDFGKGHEQSLGVTGGLHIAVP